MLFSSQGSAEEDTPSDKHAKLEQKSPVIDSAAKSSEGLALKFEVSPTHTTDPTAAAICPLAKAGLLAHGPTTSFEGMITPPMHRGLKILSGIGVTDSPLHICRQQAIAFELLTSLFTETSRHHNPIERFRLTFSDRDKFREIAAFLENNPAAEHSLEDLSKRFHINEFKLKQGFKSIHGETVFGYLRKARMLRAEELLLEGDMTILDVANHVGYSNPSHFARAYREQHGINPGEVLKLSIR